MSGAKRRISSNKGFVGLPNEDIEDDDDDMPSGNNSGGRNGVSRRRSLGGRRRSSVGSHSSKSPGSLVDQTRIAEMYSRVIKMSSENKINEKNSWNIDLIDHMGNLIKGDATGSRGVNFQKASFTLDASVKIYSCRVDDTHASSQKIVESLGRSLGVEDREGEQRGDSRVGTKSASRKLNIADTIAANVDTINSAKIERVQATDPLFYKMSKAFDDGGAKGMLMTNLRVSPTDCSLCFTSDLPADIVTSEATTGGAVRNQSTAASVSKASSGKIDIADLISRCGFDASSLLSMSICPALLSYREMVGVEESSAGLFEPSEFASYFPLESNASNATSSVQHSINQDPVDDYLNSSVNISGDDDNDYDDDNGEADFGGDSFGDFSPLPQVPSARKSMAGIALNRRSSIGGVGKIQWDSASVSESDSSEVTGDPATPGKSSIGSKVTNAVVWDASGISCSNDYSFFDMDTVNKSNSWAGARHWKYANRRQVLIPTAKLSATEEGEEEVEAPKAVVLKAEAMKGLKEKFSFDFSSEWPDEELFSISKKSVTLLTAAALEKDMIFEEEGGLFLPPDAKLQTSDLCRLMLSPNIIVPPPALAHVFIKQAASSSSKSKSQGGQDIIWGQVRKVPTAASSVFQPDLEYDDDDDDNDGGGFGEDFCDPDEDEQEHQSDIAESITEILRDGLYIGGEGHLKASRTVDKIDIGFATTSKKVNVKRLKSDIWTHIDELDVRRSSTGTRGSRGKGDMSFEEESTVGTDTEGRPSFGKDELSFQDLVTNITKGQKQKDVTLPFYFLCLLHLANEKTLTINGSEDMNDLFISKDC